MTAWQKIKNNVEEISFMKCNSGIYHKNKIKHATRWSLFGSFIIAVATLSLILVKIETINEIDGIEQYSENFGDSFYDKYNTIQPTEDMLK